MSGPLARAALDLVENMLVVTDVDGTILYVNEAFTRTTGYSSAEAVGATPAILRSGVQDDEFYADMWSQILTGRRWDGEIVNRRRDGTLYTDRMTITPLLGDQGQIKSFVAVKRDVSAHAAALTAGSPSGAAHVDSTGRLVYANPRLEQLLGMAFDQLLGYGWLAAVATAAARDGVKATIRRAAGGADQVTTIQLADGHTARVHLAPLDVGPDGPAGVVATFEDVTNEVAHQRELEQREQYARTILNSLASPTAVVDAHGVIQAVNAAWEDRARTLHADPDAVGVDVDYLEVCRRSAAAGCEQATQAEQALQSILAGSQGSHPLDYPCPEEGTWWELRITPLRTDQGGAVLSHTDISVRQELEQLLREQATTDALTGLANRTGLAQLAERAFARARRSQQPLSVFFLDLDRFKPVNDTHGHDAGDLVLQTCADRLRDVVRETDAVARIGGDEFVVLCEELDRMQATRLVTRIEEAVSQPVELPNGQSVRVGASVGLARASTGMSLEELLSTADQHMYRSKSSR